MKKSLLVRYPRLLRWGAITVGGIVVGSLMWLGEGIFGEPPVNRSSPSPPTISVPGKVLSTKELWVHRIEGKADDIRKEVDDIRLQYHALQHHIDEMNETMTTMAQHHLASSHPPSSSSWDTDNNTRPDTFDERGHLPPRDEQPPPCASVSLPEGERTPPQSYPRVGEIIPAGTYASGILTSGIAASTALNAQSDPTPVMVRLTSPGGLPRGFKADIQEAIIIAACYGDLSSERANCRLNKLLLVERGGSILSQKAEGWLIGDDGIPGIKGRVVDKAGAVVRSSFWAGILGGIASYFKATAQQPPLVLTSTGATESQQMAHRDLMRSAGGTGASNALERIADFALKRAEQMQPVILVDPGREVDVVFKEGIDMSGLYPHPGANVNQRNFKEARAYLSSYPSGVFPLTNRESDS